MVQRGRLFGYFTGRVEVVLTDDGARLGLIAVARRCFDKFLAFVSDDGVDCPHAERKGTLVMLA